MLSKHNFLTVALSGVVVLGTSSLGAAQTVGPNGEAATLSSALTLTEAEAAKLKEGKYSAALLWHTSSDFISAVTAGATHEFAAAAHQGHGDVEHPMLSCWRAVVSLRVAERSSLAKCLLDDLP